MAGEHGHAASVITDQFHKTPSDIDGCVSIVREGQYSTGVLPSHAYQPGDAMHQHASLAGTGASERQHVGLLPFIGDDSLLNRVFQALDDGAPGFGRSLPADLLVPSGQPARKKLILIQCEVVHSQTWRRGSGASLRGRWLVAIVHDSCREVAKL